MTTLLFLSRYAAGSRAVDAKNLQKLAQLKRQLSEAERKSKDLSLEAFDFSSVATKKIEARKAKEVRSTQDAKVYDPSVSDSDVAIKVKKKAKKKRKKSGSKPPHWVFDPTKKGRSVGKKKRPPEREEPKQPKPKRNDWIKAHCTICRAEFVYLPEWRPIPVLCRGCRNERKGVYRSRGGKGKRETAFTHSFTSVKVYQGGSPGGGKRR